MRNFQSLVLLLCPVLLALVSVSAQAAAPIDPQLQSALAAAAPNDTLPIIIRLAEQLDPSTFRHLPKKERRRQLVQELRATSSRSQKELRTLLQQAGIRKLKDLWHINALAVDADPALIAAIASRPEVASVSLDGLVALPPAQPAAVARAEWNLTTIGVFELWQQLQPASPGSGVVVATIDSGVEGTHPNLDNWRGGPYDWFDPASPNDLTDTPTDTDGHGTAVMGILASNSIGGEAIGVAPGAQWISANPFALGGASFADLHSSFAWALDPNGPLQAEDIAPDVVNNSWALNAPGVCVTEFQADINLLKGAGIGVVFAAGNEGPNLFTSQSPANNPNTLAVGATDVEGAVAWFSSRGSSPCDGGSVFPELAAPGVDVWSTVLGGYGWVDGTSFAAPHVAGVMALLIQSFPGATIADIETALTASAVDLGPVGPDSSYGYGQVQAMYAWRYLSGEPILSIHDPSVPENDRHLDFGNVAPETSLVRDLTLRNAGSTELQISTINFSGLPAEISLDADSCSASTLLPGASCRVALRFLPPDFFTYSGSLTIPSNDPDAASMSVTLTGTGNTPPPAASLLYPENGALNVVRPVTFSWAQVADADGDGISTALWIAADAPDFSQSSPIVMTAAASGRSAILLAGCGLLAITLLLRRRLQPLRLLLSILAALLVLSCGGGGSGSTIAGEVISSNPLTLTPFRTYYWKVQSTDARGAVTESVVRQFVTGS